MRLSSDVILFLAYAVGSVAGLIITKAWLGPAVALWRDGTYVSIPALIVAGGASLYACSFLLWLVILTRNELSVAYPVAIGLTLIMLSVASKTVLGEALTPLKVLGILTIFGGIWLVTRP